ncbi:MAG: class III poly(R)-hydroxyalkanoic acid synthase subunit PhaC [Pirellulales bacterium]|nr:class III poly(R)-hydroxyalkanoic acid synthase subunit PhaC [Planctomycetales bacterium]
MDEDSANVDAANDWMQPFLQFWRDYFEQADTATQQLLNWQRSVDWPERLDRSQLEAASKAMDAYLRSAEFLGAMRGVIDAMITTQRQSRSPSIMAPLESWTAPPGPLWEQFIDRWAQATGLSESRRGATPFDVVYQESSLRLLRYRSDVAAAVAEPVLLCFSLVNRPYILDLQPQRSVVRQLLEQGLDVYLIDWGVPSNADHTLRLHDYINKRMKCLADIVCEASGSPQINLLGYCMGGTMAAIYTSLYQRQVRNLILLAAPIDFSGNESLLNIWTRQGHLDVDGLIDAFGNCPGAFLQACFQQTKPVQNYFEKYIRLHEHSGDNAFLENFLAMERWANDSIPVAGETFREFVKMFYQQNRLVEGQLRLRGTPIDLARITCPLLLLTANFDHLVPPNSALALTGCASSAEALNLAIDAGHIGLAVSSKAHRELWPAAARWIVDHSTLRH